MISKVRVYRSWAYKSKAGVVPAFEKNEFKATRPLTNISLVSPSVLADL